MSHPAHVIHPLQRQHKKVIHILGCHLIVILLRIEIKPFLFPMLITIIVITVMLITIIMITVVLITIMIIIIIKF